MQPGKAYLVCSRVSAVWTMCPALHRPLSPCCHPLSPGSPSRHITPFPLCSGICKGLVYWSCREGGTHRGEELAAPRALVLATGEVGADFPAVAEGVEEAAVAGGTGVTAGDLVAQAGLQETDAAAGGALLTALSLQFCG